MTGSFLTSWIMFFYPKEDTLKISCWYLNWKCVRKGGSRRGVLGGRWGFLTGDLEEMVIPDIMNHVFLPQARYPENFVLISRLDVCQEGGYLEDVEGSWPETWRTESFLTSWMMFFYPKEDTLKILCWYLNYKCVRKGRSRRGVLGGRWGFLTRPMEDVVIPVVMNDVFLPQGSYTENFVLISQL